MCITSPSSSPSSSSHRSQYESLNLLQIARKDGEDEEEKGSIEEQQETCSEATLPADHLLLFLVPLTTHLCFGVSR